MGPRADRNSKRQLPDRRRRGDVADRKRAPAARAPGAKLERIGIEVERRQRIEPDLRPPPRPRPSSAPVMVTTSIPALRRRVLFGKGKSDRPAWFYSTEDEISPGAVRAGRFKAVFNLRGDDGQQTGGPRGQMSRRAASMRMRVKSPPSRTSLR